MLDSMRPYIESNEVESFVFRRDFHLGTPCLSVQYNSTNGWQTPTCFIAATFDEAFEKFKEFKRELPLTSKRVSGSYAFDNYLRNLNIGVK